MSEWQETRETLIRLEGKVDSILQNQMEDREKIKTLENNQREIERRLWGAAGIIAAIALLSPFVMHFLSK